MSIVRDLLEFYRFPSEVRLQVASEIEGEPDVLTSRIDDFDIQLEILNGHTEKYYYDKDRDFFGVSDPGEPYRSVIDFFTDDNVRYRRSIFTYDDDFKVQTATHQYGFGSKERVETFTYGTGLTNGVNVYISVAESDVSISWDDMPSSTGWPNYNMGVGILQSVVAGDNVTIDNTDPTNPVINTDDAIVSIVEGDNISVDNTDPKNPVISAVDAVMSVTAGTNVTVDNTDPQNPIISSSAEETVFSVVNCTGLSTYTIDASTLDKVYLHTINNTITVYVDDLAIGQTIDVFVEDHANGMSWDSNDSTMMWIGSSVPDESVPSYTHIRFHKVVSGVVFGEGVGNYAVLV
jgi:hypothetical protein